MEAVELSFVERSLRALDLASGELLVGSLCEDERPPRGVAGLVDWRLGGRLAARCQRGLLTGALGERALSPLRPRMSYGRLLVLGLGPRASFDEGAYAGSLRSMLDALEGLQVRRVALELPGRHLGVVPIGRAMALFVEALDARPGAIEAVAVVDERDAQRAVEGARVRPGRRTPAARR